jgi:hypothetical protein
MIIFKVQQGNHKDGFEDIGLCDANQLFEKVESARDNLVSVNQGISQWQNNEYTYINYGHPIDFFRYVAIDLRNTQEKEDQ